MSDVKIEKYDPIQEQENAQLNQRRMILEFYDTQTWTLIKNTLNQMERNYRHQKVKAIEGSAVAIKEKELYFSGKQDAIQDVFDEIQKIVAQGEAIILKNEMLKNAGGDY